MLVASQATAQEKISTIGREFWVMFLYNDGGSSNNETSLVAVGDSAATITVTNLSTGWSATDTMPAEGSVKIVVPPEASTTNESNSQQTKQVGLLVTSTADISLYANNYKHGSSDATLVLPTQALGTHYIMQDYKGAYVHNTTSRAEVGFVAVRDNTTLTMVLPCNLLNNSAVRGDTLTVTLMRGESYQLMAAAPGSFSGMEVTAGAKAFAAFQGNTLAYIPNNATGASTIYEQAVPVENWDTNYVVYSTVGRHLDHLLITSLEDSCEVYLSESSVIPLQKGQTVEIGITGGNPSDGTAGFFHRSTKKVCVGVYMVSRSAGGSNGVNYVKGNPSSVIIAPVEQGLQHVRFCALQNLDISHHYLFVLADTAYIAGITLDGNDISSRFLMTPDSMYGYVHLPVMAGVHLLESALGPVTASYYGMGTDASQAYILGRSFPNRTHPQVHRDTTEVFDTVCRGNPYNGNGFSIGGDQTDTLDSVTAWRTTEENDTIIHDFHLTLTVLPPARGEVRFFIPVGDTLLYNGDTLTIAGVYYYTFTAANGCDSVVALTLSNEPLELGASASGVCPGEEVTLNASGTSVFRWGSTPHDAALDSQQGQNPVTVRPTVTTTYSLLDGIGGAMISVTVEVEPAPVPCVTVSPEELDYDYPDLALTDCSEGSKETRWLFGDGTVLYGKHVVRQYHNMLPDSVAVTMTTCSRYGCCVDTSVTVPMRIHSWWFPNVFIPGDEANGTFGCHASCEFVTYELMVFDRHGLEVWSTTDADERWNGSKGGTPCPQDAYTYVLFYRTKDDPYRLKKKVGTVLLLR